MGNIARGEVEIILNDHTYLLLPTFNSMCRIESKLDKTMMALVSTFNTVSYMELATILQETLKTVDGSKPRTLQQIGRDIMGEGIVSTITKMQSLMTVAMGGKLADKLTGDDPEGDDPGEGDGGTPDPKN